MNALAMIPVGKNVPKDFNVIIEIPANGGSVKYEVDKTSGRLVVDRFMSAAMHYPCNYGFVPNTLADDGDPADVLVVTPHPLHPGALVNCRAIGVLHMEDESGQDSKILAVPTDKLCVEYRHIRTTDDLPAQLRERITHFFEHYKDLEKEKWVKVRDWQGVEAAEQELMASVERHQHEHA